MFQDFDRRRIKSDLGTAAHDTGDGIIIVGARLSERASVITSQSVKVPPISVPTNRTFHVLLSKGKPLPAHAAGSRRRKWL
jgi:hypothetical protein